MVNRVNSGVSFIRRDKNKGYSGPLSNSCRLQFLYFCKSFGVVPIGIVDLWELQYDTGTDSLSTPIL
jgi:hypothetical protein